MSSLLEAFARARQLEREYQLADRQSRRASLMPGWRNRLGETLVHLGEHLISTQPASIAVSRRAA